MSWKTLLDGVLAESEELKNALRNGAGNTRPGPESRLAALEEQLANTRASVDGLAEMSLADCELAEDRTRMAAEIDALAAQLGALRDSAALNASENAALRSQALTAATTLDNTIVTAEFLRVFIDSILNRAAEAERCAELLKADLQPPGPQSSSDGWSTGHRSDETGNGWSTGERVDDVDPCRGPRPDWEAALQNVKRALETHDLAALASAVGWLRPECPGDVDLLTALRDQAVALAQAEVEANEANMRSAVSNAKTSARRNAQAWASALGTIQDAITEIERSRTGTRSAPTSGTTSTGMGAGTTSTTSASSSDAASENRCLIDYPSHLSPEGQGRSYRYYVQKQAEWSAGVSAFTVLQYSSSVNQAPSIPGSTLDGPFYTYDAALAHMERLCPPSRRSTGGVRTQ